MRTQKTEMSKILSKPGDPHDAKNSRSKSRAEPRSAAKKSKNSQGEINEIKTVVSQLESKIEELYKLFSSKDGKNDYADLIHKIRAIVDVVLPVECTIIVISKGDNALLNLHGRNGQHFPQTDVGCYAGGYPASSEDTVFHLEELRNKGASHLLIPSTSFWWLEYYEGLKNHLDRNYRVVSYIENVCVIYDLSHDFSLDFKALEICTDIKKTEKLNTSKITKKKSDSNSEKNSVLRTEKAGIANRGIQARISLRVSGLNVENKLAVPKIIPLNPSRNGVERRDQDIDKVTVVMTTFNSAKFIASALQSILDQTHTSLEILIVDDASTDNTFEILQTFASKDSRIRLVKNFQNRGTYWCKNLAITKATGRYVTFQDSDDISDARRIELQLTELRKNPGTVMCTCNYVRIDSKGVIIPNRGLKQRRAIMAPLFDKDEVVARVGYFDSIRTSADDEFTSRVKLVFGDSRVAHFNAALYKAVFRSDSLTNAASTKSDLHKVGKGNSDLSFLSAPRREYVRQFRDWHQNLSKYGKSAFLPFPLSRRSFPAPSILLPTSEIADNYVTASMASMPSRQELLERAVASILPQVDILNVYLNGYKSTPKFLADPKIRVVHSSEYGDLEDNGKFFFSDSILWGYHFTMDDDIVYPPDYVQRMILKIEQYGRQAVVGCHGIILADPLLRYMKDREIVHFKRQAAEDRFVNILGTGTTAYHTSTVKLSMNNFPVSGMADLFLAVAAKRQSVPLIAVERRNNWLQPLKENTSDSLYVRSLRDDKPQTQIANREGPWRLELLWPSYPLVSGLLAKLTDQELSSGSVDSRLRCWLKTKKGESMIQTPRKTRIFRGRIQGNSTNARKAEL